MEIAIPAQELVKIDALHIDGKNPNKMSAEQRIALQKNIEHFGFIIPIIANKEGLIADGQHRWEIAKEMGMEKVPVIKLPIKDIDRRILRQVLNKLRGEHDWGLDMDEYRLIFAEHAEEGMQELLAMSDEDMQKIRELIEGVNEESALPKEREVDENLEAEHTCPKCGYQW